ncbi:class I tRNA ligase family protein [Candidatus Bathyarchaeota archaeon]|nr:class I tRNA ligase family protein [Candidatus Bathyarchaeota archaeon]
MLELYNTLTRKLEPFTTREMGKIKMYTCGPSIYRQQHIGNFRTFLFEDILQRYMEYLGYNVDRLITLTDVEDKAIDEANNEKIPITDLTKRISDVFFSELQLLKIKKPNHTPSSSTTVEQAAELIRILLEKGYAYWHEHIGRRNVYFDPLKFKDFGKLSRLDMNLWPRKKKRFHKDNYPGTPWNMGDFILWHGYKQGDTVYWDTEIGRGRPAWNVQDAAMITQHLGFTIDIACGGIDNLVRHHDYTISIIEGISGKEFSHYWLHGGHLLVDGEKMSKSKGNVYYPVDLLNLGYQPEHIRFFLIYGDYGKRLNFTFNRMRKTTQKLDSLKQMALNLQETKSNETNDDAKRLVGEILETYEKNMNKNLNVKSAFDELYNILSNLDRLRKENGLSLEDADKATTHLKRIDQVLKVIF